MSTTVFVVTVGSLALLGTAVLLLSLIVVVPLAGKTTFVTTISLPSPAGPTHIKEEAAPPATDLDQKQHGKTSDLANNRRLC